MTLRVVFRRAAKSEFEDAAVWYDAQRNGLGEEFIAEIEEAVSRAAATPARYPIVFGVFDAPSRDAFRIRCTSGFAQIC